MQIKTTDDFRGILRNAFEHEGWGLCIGAGTSYPVFPTWTELVASLIKKQTGAVYGDDLSKSLLDKFSPDTLIQAVQHQMDVSDEAFSRVLADELYANLKSKLTDVEWNSLRAIFESRNPHLEKDPSWRNYINVRERVFKETSAYSIARFVNKTIEEGMPPKTIVTFNAEPLLFSLINSFEREKFLSKVKVKGQMVTKLDRLTHSISQQSNDKIKYIFCHGLLLAPLAKKRSSLLTASDKLVFSESAYLQLASTNFSWQSTEFVSNCLNRTMIFIGVSLTDPNMRRWLSWIQKLKQVEIRDGAQLPEKVAKNAYSHVWINRSPKDSNEKKWISSCVQHLGVKIFWIEDWKDLLSVLDILRNS